MIAQAHYPKFLNWMNCVDRGASAGLPSETLMSGSKSNHSPLGASRSPVLRLTCITLLAAGMCVAPVYAKAAKAQKHANSHQEIDRLEEAWRDAILQANTAEMKALLSDDYTAITPNGTLQTKDDTLANLRSGRMHFTTLNVSDRKVRFYGNTAIVTSRARVLGTTGDGRVSGNFRYTRVYVKDRHGKWKIVSFEASRIHHGRGDRDSEFH